MNTSALVAAIDAEIQRLQQARRLLAGTAKTSSKNTEAAPTRKRHTMSAEGRAKIAAAQKKRWAAQKKAAKKA